MSRFKDHPNIYDQLICLSEKYKQAPIEVIKDFFADYRLSELREIQDQIQRVCLTAEKGIFSRPEGRTKLIDYLEQLIFLFEAAFQLSQSVSPAVSDTKPIVPPKDQNPQERTNPRVTDLVIGINGVLVDVAHLCMLVVDAWGNKVRADLKMPPSSFKKVGRSSHLAWVDINTLQSMALTLQNKLAKLSGMAIDMMIAETKTHLLNQPS